MQELGSNVVVSNEAANAVFADNVTEEQKACANARYLKKHALKSSHSFHVLMPNASGELQERPSDFNLVDNSAPSSSNLYYVEASFEDGDPIHGYLKSSYPEKINDNEVIRSEIARLFDITVPVVYGVKAKDAFNNQIGAVLSIDARRPNETMTMLSDVDDKVPLNEHDKVFLARLQAANPNEVVRDPEVIEAIIAYGLRLVTLLPGITPENFAEVRREYFEMIMFDFISHFADRRKEHIGVMRNEETGKYRLLPFFDNSTLALKPNDSEIYLMTGAFRLDCTAVLNTLFSKFYDDVSTFTNAIKLYRAQYTEMIDVIIEQNTYEKNARWLKNISHSHIEAIANHPDNVLKPDNEEIQNIAEYLKEFRQKICLKYDGKKPHTLTSKSITLGSRSIKSKPEIGKVNNLMIVLIAGIGIGSLITYLVIAYKYLI